MELTILMPCLNEELTIGNCVKIARGFIERNGLDGEVLVADNGSTDDSKKIAKLEGARVIDVEKPGYGSALFGGIKAARGKYIIMGDADLSYDFSKLEIFIEKLRCGADLVMGNRFKGGIEKGAMPRLHKYLGNPVLSFIGRLVFNIPVGDFHCGLRGFSREKILGLNLVSPGMEFASEMVVKSSLSNLSIVEIPTTLSKDGRDRPPHLNSWQDGWRHLRFLLLFSPRWLLFYPGLFIFLISLIGFIMLDNGPINIADIVFDINTQIVCSATLFLGFQLILVAIILKSIGTSYNVLPVNYLNQRIVKLLTFERCLTASVIGILTSSLFLLDALLTWQVTNYGDLKTFEVTRLILKFVILFLMSLSLFSAGAFISAIEYFRESKRESFDD